MGPFSCVNVCVPARAVHLAKGAIVRGNAGAARALNVQNKGAKRGHKTGAQKTTAAQKKSDPPYQTRAVWEKGAKTSKRIEQLLALAGHGVCVQGTNPLGRRTCEGFFTLRGLS